MCARVHDISWVKNKYKHLLAFRYHSNTAGASVTATLSLGVSRQIQISKSAHHIEEASRPEFVYKWVVQMN